jgi:hypothetical protein
MAAVVAVVIPSAAQAQRRCGGGSQSMGQQSIMRMQQPYSYPQQGQQQLYLPQLSGLPQQQALLSAWQQQQQLSALQLLQQRLNALQQTSGQTSYTGTSQANVAQQIDAMQKQLDDLKDQLGR